MGPSRRHAARVFAVVVSTCLVVSISAAEPERLWQGVPSASASSADRRVVIADEVLLDQLLEAAPAEGSTVTPAFLSIPMPDGSLRSFAIRQSPVLSAKLMARFPEIRTYSGHSVEGPPATIRLDRTPSGFHAMILSIAGATYVAPDQSRGRGVYVSYAGSSRQSRGPKFSCSTKPPITDDRIRSEAEEDPLLEPLVSPRSLRIYRAALSATSGYTKFHGGTEAGAVAALATMINRVNMIFERDISVRMVIVETAIFTDPATDPFDGLDTGKALEKNQEVLDEVVGTANYDIGHVVGTAGSGGVAALGSVCDAESKGSGATFFETPIGDGFDVDYMAHEFGHQFGADHSYNANEGGSCTTREPSVAFEPASGSTVMSYVSICEDQDLGHAADPMFNAGAIQQMLRHTRSGGKVNLTCTDETPCCGVANQTAAENQPPVVTASAAFTIPANTPFALTAQASDPADQHRLTYSWEQYDRGNPAPPHDDDGVRPLFRVYLPTASGTRTFPSMKYILGNGNVPPATYSRAGDERIYVTGETLPRTDRTMRFRVVVRDNRPADGSVAGTVGSAETLVTVVSAAGPFAVTSQNSPVTWTAGSRQQISWNVAGTNASPIAAQNVRITLSADGGQTFPFTIAEVPNSGTATVTVPSVNTNAGRIRVEAVGNIFFDVSDADLTITGATSTGRRRSVGR